MNINMCNKLFFSGRNENEKEKKAFMKTNLLKPNIIFELFFCIKKNIEGKIDRRVCFILIQVQQKFEDLQTFLKLANHSNLYRKLKSSKFYSNSKNCTCTKMTQTRRNIKENKF